MNHVGARAPYSMSLPERTDATRRKHFAIGGPAPAIPRHVVPVSLCGAQAFFSVMP